MGGRAGSMFAVFPHNDPLRRNEGMQRAKWTRPEVVIEYSVSAMRPEGKSCGGSIVFSPIGAVSCNFVAPISCIRRVWVNRTADSSE
eukprot:2543278-Lingulodinium_polyedra.AAC.1